MAYVYKYNSISKKAEVHYEPDLDIPHPFGNNKLTYAFATIVILTFVGLSVYKG